jgi:thiosulfate dehydrogenase [quinone] large subunit
VEGSVSLWNHFNQRTYLGYLAIPRIAVGYFFIQVGWAKLNPRFLSGQLLVAQLGRAASDPISWHRDFILHTVIPHAHLFGYLVCFGEIAIGVSLVLGCLVRVSSCFGAFHNLNIYLAIAIPNGGPMVGLNRIYIILHLMFVFASAGRSLGLDGILKKRFPRSWLF